MGVYGREPQMPNGLVFHRREINLIMDLVSKQKKLFGLFFLTIRKEQRDYFDVMLPRGWVVDGESLVRFDMEDN
jgi:hypothetical protein